MTNALHLAPPLTRGLLDNYATPDFYCELMNRKSSSPPIIDCVKKTSVRITNTGTQKQNRLGRSTAL